jgi:hypothetical protein
MPYFASNGLSVSFLNLACGIEFAPSYFTLSFNSRNTGSSVLP